MMVGVPGAGKSTWINSQDWLGGAAIISTDRIVDAEAARQGRTYSEIFDEYIITATGIMLDQVIDAAFREQDIVWDQTNTTARSRQRKLTMMSLDDYYKIAVVFAVPEREELERRLASRPGREIPWPVVDSMVEGFAMPTVDEGFDEIWHAS